jgi:nitrogen fixation protein FixH
MKISWGTSIVIAFGLFMAFILYLVFLVQSDKKYDNELVLSDYYKYEMNLENEQNKERNANELTSNVTIIEQDNEIVIEFPSEFDYTKITGKISLYRPSDEKLDFEIPISLSSSNLLIPRKVLADGRWDIIVDWRFQDKEYLNKKSIKI